MSADSYFKLIDIRHLKKDDPYLREIWGIRNKVNELEERLNELEIRHDNLVRNLKAKDY